MKRAMETADSCSERFSFPGNQPLHSGRAGARCCGWMGQYSNGAVLADLAGFVFVTRGKGYRLLSTPSPRDVVELYLHRAILSDEDSEQDPDRWCSHSAWGQKWWHVISQWTWNLRLELGHQLKP